MFYHRKIERLRNLDAGLRDAKRRLGALGLAGRVWSRSLGRLLDVRIVLECELPTGRARSPEPGELTYEEIRVAEQPEAAGQAARLLRVSLDQRKCQQLFVAREPGGRVVACTWNEPTEKEGARHRGIAVDRGWRGRGIASELLLFQARELARAGARVVRYRTSVGNRASRRMLHKAGAELSSVRLLTFVSGRCLGIRELSGLWSSWLKRRWEREREDVLARVASGHVASVASSGQIS